MKIIVFDDGTQNKENCPQKEDELVLQDEEDDDISDYYDDKSYTEDEDEEILDGQDDDEEEYDENGENKQKNNQNKRYSQYNGNDGQDDDGSEDEFGLKDKKFMNKRKRRSDKRLKERKKEKKLKKELHNQQINAYYEGFYYGNATSMLMYKICQQANKENNEYLWYTILGASDLLIHGKITQQQYETMYQQLAIQVGQINIQTQEEQNINESTTSESKQKNVGFIEASNEYTNYFNKNRFRFICLRHWNLYDSMYYSNYFASKLGIWNENGEKNLKRFIALLGIPLEEAKQQYKFMQSQFKEKLKDNIHSEASKFKLNNVLFNSFIRQIDEKTQISSTDMVYSLTAILECPKQILQNIFEDPLKVGVNRYTLSF